MAVQFNSYAGGPHGGSPVVLPQRVNSTLGDIGQFANQIGQIPAEMQQAEVRANLNKLLLEALTQPQTVNKSVPGGNVLTPGTTIGEMPADQSMLTMGNGASSMGDFLTKAPDQMVQAPNPAYQQSLSRLSQVGPAFGMKFPTPIENIYAAALARSLGASGTEAEKQKGRLELEGVKGSNRLNQIGAQGEVRSAIEDQRQTGRESLLKSNIESRQKIAKEHNDTIMNIAKDKNLNDQQKVDKVIAERDKHHEKEADNFAERTKVYRSQIQNQADLNQVKELDGLRDDLTKARTQIDKIRLYDTADPSVQTELRTAEEQYNMIVDRINKADPGAGMSKMMHEDKPSVWNWIRSLTGSNPTQQIVPQAGGATPPNTPTSNKPAATGGTTYDPRNISPEELKKRRDAIWNKSQQR